MTSDYVKPLLYVPHTSLDVFWNFGLESFFVQKKRIEDHAIFLFWRTSPTLMLGRYQNALAEINADYVRERDITLVRRKSGGGTIYTDENTFQYSYIQAQSSEEIEFRNFVKPVLAALQNLGIPAEFNGRNDLVAHGRKFSGAAQYKEKGYVVHHGSLLFDTNIEAMVESTSVPDYKLIDKGIRSVRERVINLKEALPAERQDMSVGEFEAYMVDYLCAVDGGGLETYELSQGEIAEAERIGEEQYRSAENLWKRNPEFSQIIEKRLPGGFVRVHLNVKKGIIKECKIEGDFFANIVPEEFSLALKDCPYRQDSLMNALQGAGFTNSFYRISLQDLVELVCQV